MNINRLGLGAGTLGNLYRRVDDEKARSTVCAAWDVGIRHFDTAPFYGFGLSERRLGDALRQYPRDEYFLSTKVGRLLKPIESASDRFGFVSPMPFEPVYDYSYDGVMRSFEDSLQRLGLSRIDCLYIHDIGRDTHGQNHGAQLSIAKTGLKALEELKEQGIIKEYGLGVNEMEICEILMQDFAMDRILLAGRYTLLNFDHINGFLDKCERQNIKVTAAGVFNSGVLATGVRGEGPFYYDYEEASDNIINKVVKLERVCGRMNVPLAAAAIHFPLGHSAVDTVLLGMSSPDRVNTNARLMEAAIPLEFWRELVNAGCIPKTSPVPK